MNPDIKVSVIVPVYNAASYLRQCLDSILAQTLKETEIICVDDGSTDASPDILEEYREKDGRVHILHQENLYAGVARNNGMEHASGKYLVFWDSDDFFYETALEKMFLQAEEHQADVCVCGGNQFYEGLQTEVPVSNYANPKRVPEELPFSMLTHPDLILNFTTEAPWNKMFRRAFIEEKQLRFQPVRNGNDVYFVISAICLADRVTVVTEPLICYRKNQTGSLVGTLARSPLTPLQAWMDARENLIAHNRFPERSFVNKALGSMFYLLRNMCTSWEAFETTVIFLKTGGLERLSMTLQPDEYYYTAWHKEALTHLYEDSPQEFLAYLLHETYIQLTEANAKKQIQAAKNRMKQQELKQQKTDLKEKNRVLKAEISRLEAVNAEAAAEIASLRKDEQQLEAFLQELKAELKKSRESWPFRIAKFFSKK